MMTGVDMGLSRKAAVDLRKDRMKIGAVAGGGKEGIDGCVGL
jgi:hypothetical protein